MTNANPSINPADTDTLTGTLRFIFKKFLQDVDDMLPCVVISADRGPPARVQVQPQIMVLGTNGERVSRAQIASVPVLELGAGGFIMSFPLRPGDRGWIKANDRDISLYLQNQVETRPNTFRMHNFSDGLFIPDIMGTWDLDEEDEGNAVLQSTDGTVKIALWSNKIKMLAPDVEIVSNVLINGTLTVTGGIAANGGMSTTGGGVNSSIVTGNFRTIGNITASRTITPLVP